MREKSKIKIRLLIVVFLIIDISIVLIFLYVSDNTFKQQEEIKGNQLIQQYKEFTYSLQDIEYKEDNPDIVSCISSQLTEQMLLHTEYSMSIDEFTRTTRVLNKFVIPLNDSTVCNNAIAVTLMGDWKEKDGVDGCRYINELGTNLRIDYYILPIQIKEDTIVTKVKQIEDVNIQNVTTIATSTDNAELLSNEVQINGYKQIRDFGFKILNDTKYIVCNTYIEVTDRLLVALRYYIDISCLNTVSFEELAETEIDMWPMKSHLFNILSINGVVKEIKRVLNSSIADIFLYGQDIDNYTRDFTNVKVSDEWEVKMQDIGIDITHKYKENNYYDKIYMYREGLIYFKVLDVSADKINAENRDSLALSLSSNLINIELINAVDERIDGLIVRKVKGLTLHENKRKATLNIFLFTDANILEISIVDFVHADTDINLESLLMVLNSKIGGVKHYDN